MSTQALSRRASCGLCRGEFGRRGRWRGLTLLELLISLSVGAIVAAMALPAVNRLLIRNQLTVSYNQLLIGAVTARQAAVSQNVSMSFCAGEIEAGCHGDWSLREWIVFQDADQDGQIDPGDRVKLVGQLPESAQLSVAGNGPFRSFVSFKPIGTAQTSTGAFAAGRLRVCITERMDANAIDLVLIGSGRMEPERRDFAGECPAP